jgi:hypothetical protein
MLVHFYKFIDKLRGTPARKNKIILIATATAVVLNIIIWLVIYLRLRPLVINLPEEQSFIPLHYNIYLGVDNFGKWTKTFMIPGLGLLFLIINTILALTIYSRKEILSYFLVTVSAVVQVLLLISTILVVLINI